MLYGKIIGNLMVFSRSVLIEKFIEWLYNAMTKI
jgi:hypothetical protein